MDKIERKIRQLSPSQLRALYFLAKSEKGVVSSYDAQKIVGKKGKALGAIFSSLSRRKFGSEVLIIPFGRSDSGHGLRWKLNEKLITRERLLAIIKEIIKS